LGQLADKLNSLQQETLMSKLFDLLESSNTKVQDEVLLSSCMEHNLAICWK